MSFSPNIGLAFLVASLAVIPFLEDYNPWPIYIAYLALSYLSGYVDSEKHYEGYKEYISLDRKEKIKYHKDALKKLQEG